MTPHQNLDTPQSDSRLFRSGFGAGQVKAVIFDFFGVFTTDRWKEFVATLPEAQKQPARDSNHAFDQGKITEAQFVERIVNLTGRDRNEIAKILVSDGDKNDQLLQYVATLKPKYKIGLLSNVASNMIRDMLLTPSEQALFDNMTFSYEEGMTKPDPRIYHIASERLGVLPGESVFIDDTDPYCAAAREAGLQAIVYRDFVQMKGELEAMLRAV